MNENIKKCSKHGDLKTNEISKDKKCLQCCREYSLAYRKKYPEKIKKNNDLSNAARKEAKINGFEFKPIRKNKVYKDDKTSIECAKHGHLEGKDLIFRDNRYLRCRLCQYERNKSWQERNPEKVKAQKRRTYLSHIAQYTEESILRQKNITKEQYISLVERQKGLCAICGYEETLRKRKDGTRSPLAIDHDHKTGLIRELLCNKCNRAIGLFNEDVERMLNAINYLRRHNDASTIRQRGDPTDSN